MDTRLRMQVRLSPHCEVNRQNSPATADQSKVCISQVPQRFPVQESSVEPAATQQCVYFAIANCSGLSQRQQTFRV